MKTQLSRKFDMLRRVQGYMDDAGAKLAGVNASAARKELDGIVSAMALNEAEEGNGALNAKGQVAKLKVLRADLWIQHMLPVATIAAAHLRDVPEFSAMRMPPHRVKSATLVQHAVVMADAARERQQVFVENGLPEDFADALSAAAAAVRASVDARGKSLSVKASARRALKVNGSRAQVVLRLLDAQVRKVLVNDPKALAGWSSVKRIGRGKVTPIGVTTPPASGQAADTKAA